MYKHNKKYLKTKNLLKYLILLNFSFSKASCPNKNSLILNYICYMVIKKDYFLQLDELSLWCHKNNFTVANPLTFNIKNWLFFIKEKFNIRSGPHSGFNIFTDIKKVKNLRNEMYLMSRSDYPLTYFKDLVRL